MNKKLISLCALILVTQLVFAFGNREQTAPAVQVTGVVRLVGTSIFPEIVISGSQNEWYAAREEQYKLHDLQHRTVTVEGNETVIELTFGNGLPAGIRRELRNIRIISVH